MATETDTLSFSLPTSTAPTDVSESTCMPNSAPFLPPSPYHPQGAPAHANAEWDTTIHPLSSPQKVCAAPTSPSPAFNCGPGTSVGTSGSGSGSGCFNDGGLLYRVQAERECREGPGK